MTNPYPEYPKISPNYKVIERHNPVSGHRWNEFGNIVNYDVTGGGWMRTTHRTLKGAEVELNVRLEILKERKERGEEL